MAEEWEQEPAGAELIALLRDLTRNQTQITDTQRLMEETPKKLAENKVSGEQNGHSTNHRQRHITEKDFQPSKR